MSETKRVPMLEGAAADQEIRRLTRRNLVLGAAATLAGIGAWRWLLKATPENGIPWPLRRILHFNESVAGALVPPRRLAPTFPADRVQGKPRTNGMVGLDDAAADWQLRVQHEGQVTDLAFDMNDIRQLPRLDLVTELKCVEGWSEVMHFGGVRFVDFVNRFGLARRPGRRPAGAAKPEDLYRYVYLTTPDQSYYVGLDMVSALHPQTMLCDTMNWKPLTPEHGAPLRLYLAVKYGYKSLKRIGLIRFTDERPPDFWGERGYDWYAGL
jgi:DMSO/TMAO reductase YedYZ molybdopterin-dependent catalytic subunit